VPTFFLPYRGCALVIFLELKAKPSFPFADSRKVLIKTSPLIAGVEVTLEEVLCTSSKRFRPSDNTRNSKLKQLDDGVGDTLVAVGHGERRFIPAHDQDARRARKGKEGFTKVVASLVHSRMTMHWADRISTCRFARQIDRNKGTTYCKADNCFYLCSRILLLIVARRTRPSDRRPHWLT
jgi:hypothetical protein